jgi:hypothetical protein
MIKTRVPHSFGDALHTQERDRDEKMSLFSQSNKPSVSLVKPTVSPFALQKRHLITNLKYETQSHEFWE